MRLGTAKEFYEAAPKGRYKMKIIAAECKLSQKSNAPMIAITLEIRSDLNGNVDHAGDQVFDYLLTDESFKGAGMGKAKLRGLGVDVDREQSDEEVCGQLLGREVIADLVIEQRRDKNNNLQWQVDAKTGKQIPLDSNKAIAYFTQAVSGASMSLVAKDVGALPAGITVPAGVAPVNLQSGAPPVTGFPGFPGAAPNPAAGGVAIPPFAGVQAPVKEEKKDPPAV